eukprot:6213109-Pleurochrysis_carterae.AAC.8
MKSIYIMRKQTRRFPMTLRWPGISASAKGGALATGRARCGLAGQHSRASWRRRALERMVAARSMRLVDASEREAEGNVHMLDASTGHAGEMPCQDTVDAKHCSGSAKVTGMPSSRPGLRTSASVGCETRLNSAPRRDKPASKAMALLGVEDGVPDKAGSRPVDERKLPSKALKFLGATIDEVRMDKASRVLGDAPWVAVPVRAKSAPALRWGSPLLSSSTYRAASAHKRALSFHSHLDKASELLGAPVTVREACTRPQDARTLATKALNVLGATFDDVRMEKALKVLGETPGCDAHAANADDLNLCQCVPK